MKTKLVIFSALAFVVFFACKSPVTTLAIADSDLTYASTKWSGTTKETLQSGYNIYTNKCNQCHKLFSIDKFSEKKWAHEIDDMAPKAKLSPEEKEELYRYIMARLNTLTAASKK